MSQGSWRAPFRLSIARMLVGALVCAGLTACAAGGARPVAPADTVVFPDPEMATIKGGIFVGADQLGQVAGGMSKPQVYAVLGVSHFSEGVSSGAREWNYLFNFRDSGDQVQQCQFMLQFDENDRVVGSHWKPASCEARMHSEAPVAPPMATWTKPAPVAPEPAVAAGKVSPVVKPPVADVAAAKQQPEAEARALAGAAPKAPAVVQHPSAFCPAVPVATAAAQPSASASATPASTPAASGASLPATSAAVAPPATPPPVAVTPSATVPLAPLSLSSDAAFSSGSTHLSAEGRERLDSMLLQVQFPTELHAIHIVGFSDRIGTKRGNLRLSRQRAEAVRQYLIEGGVPADQVTAEGRGEADPQVQCSEKGKKALSACLAPNRRVEITGMAATSSP